jgi:hypothetical protein
MTLKVKEYLDKFVIPPEVTRASINQNWLLLQKRSVALDYDIHTVELNKNMCKQRTQSVRLPV